MLSHANVARLIVAGDLVESPRPCRRTRDDVQRLREWLTGGGVTLLALAGNHDRGWCRPSGRSSLYAQPISATCDVLCWTIGHGHEPIAGERTISGHLHPVLRVERTVAPCFLVSAKRIILPAFSSNAAGLDVGTAVVPKSWLAGRVRCLASTGSEILDFGLLADLRRSLCGTRSTTRSKNKR